MNSLPRYSNIYKIVCHICKHSHEFYSKDDQVLRRPMQLLNVKDQFGFKTENYVCYKDKDLDVAPATTNSSRVLVQEAEKPNQWKTKTA